MSDEVKAAIELIKGVYLQSPTCKTVGELHKNGFDTITAELEAKDAEITKLKSERDNAIKECSKYAKRAGEAEGKLEVSENYNVIDGWKRKCEHLEHRIKVLERALGREARLSTFHCCRCHFEPPCNMKHESSLLDKDIKSCIANRCEGAIAQADAESEQMREAKRLLALLVDRIDYGASFEGDSNQESWTYAAKSGDMKEARKFLAKPDRQEPNKQLAIGDEVTLGIGKIAYLRYNEQSDRREAFVEFGDTSVWISLDQLAAAEC